MAAEVTVGGGGGGRNPNSIRPGGDNLLTTVRTRGTPILWCGTSLCLKSHVCMYAQLLLSAYLHFTGVI